MKRIGGMCEVYYGTQLSGRPHGGQVSIQLRADRCRGGSVAGAHIKYLVFFSKCNSVEASIQYGYNLCHICMYMYIFNEHLDFC